jgi:AraC-like DNA-binding protein
VCDALTPLVLTPDLPYRARQPFAGQRSTVLVMDGAALGQLAPLRLDPAAHWRLACCRAALEQGEPDRLAFEEVLLGLLPQAQAAASDADRTSDRAVERARELLASDPSSSRSLSDIAQAVAASPFHLARRFKRANGVGLHRYRTRLRMALALARLGDGATDLTALALDLGFNSHSHFSAAFGAHFGVAPSRARDLLGCRARI